MDYTNFKLLLIRKDLYDAIVEDIEKLCLETYPSLHLLKQYMLNNKTTGKEWFEKYGE